MKNAYMSLRKKVWGGKHGIHSQKKFPPFLFRVVGLKKGKNLTKSEIREFLRKTFSQIRNSPNPNQPLAIKRGGTFLGVLPPTPFF